MKLTLFIAVCLLSIHLDATVKGIVKDADTGEELIGATLVWKGNPTKGRVSGLDGSFSIEKPDRAAILICSHVGYATVEYPVAGADVELTVLLKPLEHRMDEVVVYGNLTTGERK